VASGALFGREATTAQERSVDLLDMDAAVLHGLDGIGDLHQLARGGVGIIEGVGVDEFRGHNERRSDEGDVWIRLSSSRRLSKSPQARSSRRKRIAHTIDYIRRCTRRQHDSGPNCNQ